ncbi:MAG TPA: ankyrin repeat domain-containing protein [Vicinamibacterales bacterium]|nr:ankyrin repeat domain-containing protein [Vicinamibacterales bacterium]
MKFAILCFSISALALAQAPPLTKAEQLQDAARKGDAAAVKKLLDDGVDVNTKFRYNATALFYACDHGHIDVVKVLLDRGADLTVKDTFYGFTPLALSLGPAQKKKPEHTEIAKLLIARGAPGKDMALTAAVQSGDTSLAQTVLDSGGLTPAQLSDALEAARAQNKSEMAALLDKAGAKPYQDFPIEAATLARLAGTYRNPTGTAEIVVTVAAPRLNLTTSNGQKLTLVAQDARTFKAIGMGATFVFDIAPEAVKSFTITPMQGAPIVYTRVEGK